jgi:hypothetical protein
LTFAEVGHLLGRAPDLDRTVAAHEFDVRAGDPPAQTIGSAALEYLLFKVIDYVP